MAAQQFLCSVSLLSGWFWFAPAPHVHTYVPGVTPTLVLPRPSGSIPSENQTGQAPKTGQTQDACNDKPAVTTKKIRLATTRERSHGKNCAELFGI